MSKPTIVIGSGIGGLTAAARLAHHGQKVLVFEQARFAGGYLNPFKRKGFDFSPGLHLMSDGAEGPLGRSFASMGVDAEFIPLPDLGFEVHHFPDLEVPFHRDQKVYFNQLKGIFPESAKELGKFAKLVERVGHDIDWFNDQPLTTKGQFIKASAGLALRLSPIVRYRNATWQDLLDRFISDKRLQGVLSAWCNALGMPPNRMSCIAGAGYYRTFGDYGGHYVKHGGRGLRDALVGAITSRGGEVIVNQRVDKVLMEGSSVAGIQLAGSGEKVASDVVISNVDPKQLYGKLLGDVGHPKAIHHKLDTYLPAFGYFFYCCGLDPSGIEDNPLLSVSTRRAFSSFDVNAHFDLQQIKDGLGPFFFATCPTSRDKSKAPEGKALLEVVSTMPAEFVMEWAELPVGKRGEEYEQRKAWYTERLLDRLAEYFIPDIRDRIIVQESGTPATNYTYTLNSGGAGSGLAMTPDRMGANRFPIVTHLKGLYVCGTGTPLGPGLNRCAKSGWCAAGAALERHRKSDWEPPRTPGLWT